MMQAAVFWTSWTSRRVERLTEEQEVAIAEVGSDLGVDEEEAVGGMKVGAGGPGEGCGAAVRRVEDDTEGGHLEQGWN